MEYIMMYPILWAGLLSFGLALCRLKVTPYIKQLVLSTTILWIISVTVQYYKLAYLLGILLPIIFTLCFWLIFKLRLFHAFLVALSLFASASISELLYNSLIAEFQFEQALIYQQNDLALVCILLGLQHIGMYALLHKLRLGFTFIAPSRLHTPVQPKYSRTWFILTLGFSFLLALFNISVYFNNQLVIPVIVSFSVCWIIMLVLSYRKEMEE
jgi:hypothetical protein